MQDAAADEENLLKAMWESCKGRELQTQIGWSQAWGRVGWYFTLPRAAAWGVPERQYFEDLSDDEIEQLRKEGKITEVDDGKYAESSDSWFERIREHYADSAVSGESMFMLRAYPPDMVYPRFDDDGNLKYGVIMMEMPESECQPGSDLMTRAGKYAGVEDPSKYGVWVKDGKVVSGMVQGGEPHSQDNSRLSLAIFVTPNEVYYFASASPTMFTGGKLLWCGWHGGGMTPLVPVPAYLTDSRKPGAEFSSPCEPVFAMQPLLNQVETLLSNVAAYNAIPRWVIEDEDGNIISDPETGQPKMVDKDANTPGLDPSEATVVGGRLRQLTVDANTLVDLLRFYSAEMEKARPSPIMQGAAGTSGPAWNLRQQIEQINETLREPAENHAMAMKTIFRLWIRWMRMLNRPVVYFLAPGQRKNKFTERALIEINPEDLTEAIIVEQDSQSASDRIVLDQVGIEKLEKGLIDRETYYERYAKEEDPQDMILRADLAKVVQAVMYGDNNQIQPGSLMADVVDAVRGRLTWELMRRSPNFALAQAEAMTAEQQMMSKQQLPGGGMTAPSVPETGGNIAETQGLRQPGIGMPMDLQGSPGQAMAMPGAVA